MRTTFLSDKLLNHVYRNTAYTQPTTVYAALLTAVTDAEAGTVTETTYTGYARQAITFGAPAGSGGGRQISNTGAITFPAKGDATGDPLSFIAVGIYDALTVGNLLDVIYLDGADPFDVICTDITGNLLRSPSHGLTANQQVRFEQFPGTGTIPTGLSENTTYFVIATGLTTDDFSVSTTQGGAAVDITAVGKALLHRLTPKSISINDQPNFAIGSLKLTDD